MSRVLVVGSLNMDLVVATDVFPRPGETLFGTNFATHAGGKGANQAVAAARLGAQVTMIGRVGRDAFGAQMKAGLAAEGIEVDWVSETDQQASGIAVITVYKSDNAILVVPGANASLTPADLDAAENAFATTDIVLAQLEVPMATVARAAELAERHRKPFVLNPAPATRLPRSLIERCTLLTPNEYELATALGTNEVGWSELLRTLPGRVVMTKGAEGAYFRDAGGTLHCQKGFAVTPVDTTGAGDTFNGAIATFWDQGLQEAVRLGCAAGALSVTKPGARGGMPTAAELRAFLEKAG